MEYRKLDVGTKLRFVGDSSEYNSVLECGDELILITDDESGCPYKARCERTDDWYWFYSSSVELIDVSAGTTFESKSISLGMLDDTEFTLHIGKDVQRVIIMVGDTRVSVTLDAFLAAAKEFAKEAR